MARGVGIRTGDGRGLRDLRGMIGSLVAATGIAPGRRVAFEALGPEGWARLGATSRGLVRSRLHVSLDYHALVELFQPGLSGLFLHPFSLTLSSGGCVLEEWSDTLSRFWHLKAKTASGTPSSRQSPRFEAKGRLPLLDLDLPARSEFELHLRLPWQDRDKREGFEAFSHLESAILSVYAQGWMRRLWSEPGLEHAVVG